LKDSLYKPSIIKQYTLSYTIKGEKPHQYLYTTEVGETEYH